jgi:hypothetical protein
MRIVQSIDEAIRVKMAELREVVEARQRMEDKIFAVELGQDKTFWKKGFTTVRTKRHNKTVIRRREVA